MTGIAAATGRSRKPSILVRKVRASPRGSSAACIVPCFSGRVKRNGDGSLLRNDLRSAHYETHPLLDVKPGSDAKHGMLDVTCMFSLV